MSCIYSILADCKIDVLHMQVAEAILKLMLDFLVLQGREIPRI
jgi:hypothetical protein